MLMDFGAYSEWNPYALKLRGGAAVGDTIALTPRSERNPILVNEEPITSSHALADGDKVQFGNPGASILRIRTIPGL